MLQDLRFGVRMLRNQPSFTLLAVLTLAIGIGANAALFSLVEALLLRKLPVQQPTELVLFKRSFGANPPFYDFPYPWYERLREQPQVFGDVAANWLIERVEAAEDAHAVPGQVRVGMASGNYFATLGITSTLGRMFTVEDNRVPGGHPVAVISHAYWERRFALAPDIIGRTVRLAETTYTIIGVTPRGFTGEVVGRPADLWVPFMMAAQVMPEVTGNQPNSPAKFSALIIGRLKPGVTGARDGAAARIRSASGAGRWALAVGATVVDRKFSACVGGRHRRRRVVAGAYQAAGACCARRHSTHRRGLAELHRAAVQPRGHIVDGDAVRPGSGTRGFAAQSESGAQQSRRARSGYGQRRAALSSTRTPLG